MCLGGGGGGRGSRIQMPEAGVCVWGGVCVSGGGGGGEPDTNV